MPLNSPTIDLVTKPLPGDKGKLVLYIIDSGEFVEPVQRKDLLRLKLSRYLDYARSPDFRKEHHDIAPRDILIRVLHTTLPGDLLAIQSIGSPEDPENNMTVEFGDYNEFRKKLHGRPNP
jgi:hypothetical protein